MRSEFLTFGEFLWDCLPAGRHGGGAPFNVASQLAQLGRRVSLISAVGRDQSGDDLLQLAKSRGVNVSLVSRVAHLPTGTVSVTLDQQGNPSYEIFAPVAWDEITVTAEVLSQVKQGRALAFSSLGLRFPHNREQLGKLLAIPGPLKLFDANLRPPFAEPELVVSFARQSDILKFNEEELRAVTAWIEGKRSNPVI